MVRKWSYLNKININFLQSLYIEKFNIYKFKIFRSTTRFKKYNRTFLTSFVRKNYSKRKHKTNWISMLYVLKNWIFFYFRYKQFVRYYQVLGYFNSKWNISFPSVAIKLINNLWIKLIKSFNTFYITKIIFKKYFFFLKFESKLFKHTNNLQNGIFASVANENYNTLGEESSINSCLLNYDNFLYNNTIKKNIKNIYIYNNLNKFFYLNTIKFVVLIYKILILLNLNFKNII